MNFYRYRFRLIFSAFYSKIISFFCYHHLVMQCFSCIAFVANFRFARVCFAFSGEEKVLQFDHVQVLRSVA